MAINKTINLDINTNSKETQAEFERLRKAIKASTEEVEALSKEFGENSAEADKARKSLAGLTNTYDQMSKVATDLGATFEDVKGEIQPLTGRMGELEDRLYELAAAGDTTSREYRDLLKAVGEYRKVQIQTDLAVDGAATTMTQKLGTALNGAASGFALVQGAAALFGDENEELNKTLLKVQSALAIQQGLQGLTEAYKQLGGLTKAASIAQAAFATVTGATTGALKVLRIAMASTGIGLLVAGIGLLIANFDKVWEVIKKGIDIALVPVKAAIDAVTDAYYAVTDALGITSKAEREAAKATEERASAQERIEQQWENYKQQLKEESEAIQKLIDDYKRFENAQSQWANAELNLRKARGENTEKLERKILEDAVNTQNEIIKKTTERHQKLIEAGDEAAQEIADQLTQAIAAEVQAQTNLAAFETNLLKERQAKYKAFNKARLDASRQIEDIENDLLKDGIEKELEINRDKFRRLREDTAKNTELTAKERKRLTELYTEQESQAEAKIRDKYKQLDLDREEAAAQALKEVKVKTGLETLNDLQTQLNKEIELKKAAAAEEARIEAEKKELVKRNREFAIESTKQSLEVILSLTELFGKKGEKQARKAFQIQKAAQIASATIDTYRNAVSAYGSQFVPVPDPSSPVRGGIAAGIAVAAGLANIAAIASQKFEGGGGGSVTEPSTAGLEGGTIAPQFNVVGDSGINQLAQLQQQPVQAYVVSGEVTSAQALDRNRVKNATL